VIIFSSASGLRHAINRTGACGLFPVSKRLTGNVVDERICLGTIAPTLLPIQDTS
jgi:hypothetical protein